ncbi:hypothetical protein K5X82_17480 [Halosquirtibacter xylanolyticus]|uniref:hypothetical protein n=1 Tax=Halosquirtibacter xylanolyticus TaxID=3374599 RepID=UPI00374A00CB|nr:hypothetical protein K5X82_17480 [Prolixibacteraceae bacterium]
MKQLSTTMSKLCVAIFLFASLWGCGIQDYKFDNLEVKKTEAKLAAPLAKGSFKVWDLIGNISKDYLVKDSSGEIKFVYRQNDVIQYKLNDYFQFPSSIPIGGDQLDIPAMDLSILSLIGTIPPIEYTNSHTVNISETTNTELNVYSVKVASGKLAITVDNRSALSGVNLEIRLNNCTYPDKVGAGVLTFRVPLETGSNIYSVDLSGALFDFAANGDNPEMSVTYRIEFPSTVKGKVAKSTIDFSMSMNNLQFDYFKGNIGHQTIDIPTTDVEINMPMLDKLGEGIQFAAPVFQLETKCGFIIPTIMTPEISGENNDGTKLDLTVPVMSVTCPSVSNYNDVANGVYRLDKKNTNLVEFFSLPPSKKVSIGGSVKVNYASDGTALTTTSTSPNLITPTSSFSADLLMEVPLSFSAKNISFTDTIEVSLGDISFVHDTHLYISYENRIPLELDLELQPVHLEKKQLVGTPIKMNILKSPKVDNSGLPVSVLKGVEKIGLTASDIENIQNSDALILNVKANTPDNKVVKLNADDFINLRIAASANVVYNENN